MKRKTSEPTGDSPAPNEPDVPTAPSSVPNKRVRLPLLGLVSLCQEGGSIMVDEEVRSECEALKLSLAAAIQRIDSLETRVGQLEHTTVFIPAEDFVEEEEVVVEEEEEEEVVVEEEEEEEEVVVEEEEEEVVVEEEEEEEEVVVEEEEEVVVEEESGGGKTQEEIGKAFFQKRREERATLILQKARAAEKKKKKIVEKGINRWRSSASCSSENEVEEVEEDETSSSSSSSEAFDWEEEEEEEEEEEPLVWEEEDDAEDADLLGMSIEEYRASFVVDSSSEHIEWQSSGGEGDEDDESNTELQNIPSPANSTGAIVHGSRDESGGEDETCSFIVDSSGEDVEWQSLRDEDNESNTEKIKNVLDKKKKKKKKTWLDVMNSISSGVVGTDSEISTGGPGRMQRERNTKKAIYDNLSPRVEEMEEVEEVAKEVSVFKKVTGALAGRGEERVLASLGRVVSIGSAPIRNVPCSLGIKGDGTRFRELPVRQRRPEKGQLGEWELFPHQVLAINFMLEREEKNPDIVHGLRGGIIMMTMGLGKTLTAIVHSLISPRPSRPLMHGSRGFPTLIVASKTLMLEWRIKGFEKFFGSSVKVLYLHKDFMRHKEYATISRRDVVGYDFVITTYDVCQSVCRSKIAGQYREESLVRYNRQGKGQGNIKGVSHRTLVQSNRPNVVGPAVIYTTPWERVIWDESHCFTNFRTAIFRNMMAIYGKYKWCLTGTPIRNYETDIWAQLRVCGYTGTVNEREWKKNFRERLNQDHLLEAILAMENKDAGDMGKLPEKIHTVSVVALKGSEQRCYSMVKEVTDNAFRSFTSGFSGLNYVCVLALFIRMRQCCVAPYLITSESKRVAKKTQMTDTLLHGVHTAMGRWLHDPMGTAGIYSAKMTEIVRVIQRIPPGGKVLVFSNFTSVLDLVAKALEIRVGTFGFVQIDGDTKGPERARLFQQFRTRPLIRGLLMTYRVGSEGLNLTEANHVICVEPWWNNAVHDQASARCWRSGQTKSVHVHNIYVDNSIEQRIVEFCKKKDRMAKEILSGSAKGGVPKLSPDNLGALLGIRRSGRK